MSVCVHCAQPKKRYATVYEVCSVCEPDRARMLATGAIEVNAQIDLERRLADALAALRTNTVALHGSLHDGPFTDCQHELCEQARAVLEAAGRSER